MSTNIYTIEPAEGYEWLLPVDPNDYEHLVFDGRPRGKTWRPIRMRRLKFSRGLRRLPCDLPSSGNGDHLPMTQRARAKIGPFIEKYGEFLPLACDDGDFCTFHVTNVIDALDERASDVLRSSEEPNIVLLIHRHAFRPEKLTDDWMFKLPQSRGRGGIYVTDPFVNLIRTSGLTGLDFRRVWPHS